MNANLKFPQRLVLVAALAAFSSAGAIADKPEWAGNKAAKADKGGAKSGHGDHGHGGFSDDARREVNDYYGTRFKAGKCPPGLAKKNNGCMPPGQAKKWATGQPLPKDVHYYELPRELILRLPPPPPQHRYVRVAADILLIAIGTSMVIDAIEDIGR